MSLYQKYRPTELSEVKGNQDTITALENYLKDFPKCPHVFLFTGLKGCGKTSVARIMAKRLGCQGSDLKELNMADFRGIETSREIIQHAAYKPMEGTARGWILDEFHRATPDAMSAFLKIFEDTPKHVFFFLCTTDPQKLLSTIKDRCAKFEMKPLSDSQMKGLLRRVLHEENENIADEVYDLIIRDSMGHPRNALQILDKVLQVSPERQLETARQSAVEVSESIALCRALIEGAKWKKVSEILKGLREHEPESIRRHVLGYAQSVLLNGENNLAGLILEEFMEPNFTNGFPQLVYACYSVTMNQ